MRNRPTARFVNGVVAALIVAFLFAHSLLGGLEGIFPLTAPPKWILWLGVIVVGIHVVVSIVTSYSQLTDAEFPPSARKKRHLLLKWVSGGALAVVAAAHIVYMQTSGAHTVQASPVSAVVALVLIVALAVHSWIGAKSLVTDLGFSKRLMLPFRIVVCALAVAAGCIVLLGMVR